MDFFSDIIYRLPEYKSLEKAVSENRSSAATGLTGIHKANVITALRRRLSKKALVIVGEEQELYKKEIEVKDVNLLLFDKIKDWLDVEVKTRYSVKSAKAKIKQDNDKIRIIFDTPQRAITPGQSAVFYLDDIVVGGGKII